MGNYKSKYTGEQIDEILDRANVSVVTCSIDYADSNPSTCVSYYDGAVSLAPGSTNWDEWFGIYPCLLKDGIEVGRLNPNDFSKFIDGTDADITSGNAGDVMIAFPIRGLRIETVNNKLIISMTKEKDNPNYKYYAHQRGTVIKDKFYLGAFKSSLLNDKTRSLSGYLPLVNKTISQIRELAQANGSGYNITGFYQLTYIQAMFILKYKDLNSQLALGKGYTNDSNSSAIATGGTVIKGMNFGEDTGTQQMKVFGIEDFWGNVYEFIDGVYCDEEFNLWTTTDNFNDNHEGYTKVAFNILTVAIDGWASKVQGTTETGFIVKEASGSATTYFADNMALLPSRVDVFGGDFNGPSGGTNIIPLAGAFQQRCTYKNDSHYTDTGSRLMFI